LENVHGRSLVPLLRGQPVAWRESFLAEYFLEKVAPRAPAWQAVRTARWKYIHYTELEGMDELYDLEKDPCERRNLWHDGAYQGVKLKLLQRLCDRMAWTVDPLPVREGPY
jgi:arylsulfatase A-like enzyme